MMNDVDKLYSDCIEVLDGIGKNRGWKIHEEACLVYLRETEDIHRLQDKLLEYKVERNYCELRKLAARANR
jgi:hypothetical protein